MTTTCHFASKPFKEASVGARRRTSWVVERVAEYDVQLAPQKDVIAVEPA
jgi:hypothetical protein